VTVTSVDHPPVAVGDTATISKGAAVKIGVLSNDSDPDGDALTLTAVTKPGHGTAVINPDKTILRRSATRLSRRYLPGGTIPPPNYLSGYSDSGQNI
jgi:hypothetical protein